MTVQNQLNIILTFTSDNLVSISHVDIFDNKVYAYPGTNSEDCSYYTVDSIMGDY